MVSRRLYDEGMVAKLFSNIALRMKDRPGGYTRMLKLGERAGDASEMVILELVDYTLDTENTSGKQAKKAAKQNSKKDKKVDNTVKGEGNV
jgi:large subunit ribosomal protein L17